MFTASCIKPQTRVWSTLDRGSSLQFPGSTCLLSWRARPMKTELYCIHSTTTSNCDMCSQPESNTLRCRLMWLRSIWRQAPYSRPWFLLHAHASSADLRVHLCSHLQQHKWNVHSQFRVYSNSGCTETCKSLLHQSLTMPQFVYPARKSPVHPMHASRLICDDL